MDCVAIDLGGHNSQVCQRSSKGELKRERRVPTRGLAKVLKGMPPARVVLEACAEAFAVADQARACGHEVVVVPSTTVKALGVGARGIKTDKRDARVLSDVGCKIALPSVHVPAHESRERKAMIAAREALVHARTGLINTVRGWLRTKLIKVPTGATKTFAQRVRSHLEDHPEGLPLAYERLLHIIEELSHQLLLANEELEQIAKDDPVCTRLMSVPGVGPTTAISFQAAIDDHKRFPNAHAAESYLGLTPGEHSSGERKRRTGITKAGSTRTRYLLLQAAWCFWRTRPNDPAVRWAHQIELRRGRKIAITALARKLAGVLFAIMRDGSVYDPTRAAKTNT